MGRRLLAALLLALGACTPTEAPPAETGSDKQSVGPESLTLVKLTTSPSRVVLRYSKNLNNLCAHLLDADQNLLHTPNLFCDDGADVTVTLPLNALNRPLQVGEQVRLCPGNQSPVPCSFGVVEAEADCTGVTLRGDGGTAYPSRGLEATALGITEWLLSPPELGTGTTLVYRGVARNAAGLIVGNGTLRLNFDEVMTPGAVVDAAMAERIFVERSFVLASGAALTVEQQKALWRELSLDAPHESCVVPSTGGFSFAPVVERGPEAAATESAPATSLVSRLGSALREVTATRSARSEQSATQGLDTAPGPFATCRNEGEAAYAPTLALLPQLYQALQSGNLLSIVTIAAEPIRLHAEYNCCSGQNTPVPGKTGQPYQGCTCAERFPDEYPRRRIIEPPDLRDGFDVQYVCEGCPTGQFFNEDAQRCSPKTLLVRDDSIKLAVGQTGTLNIFANDLLEASSTYEVTFTGVNPAEVDFLPSANTGTLQLTPLYPGVYSLRYSLENAVTKEKSNEANITVEATCPADRPYYNAGIGYCDTCPAGQIFNGQTGQCEACQNPTQVAAITVTPANCSAAGNATVGVSAGVSPGYYLLQYEPSAYNIYKGYNGNWTYNLKVKTPGQPAGAFVSDPERLTTSEDVAGAMAGRSYTMPVYAGGTAYFYAQPGSCNFNRGEMKATLLRCANPAPTPPQPEQPPTPPTCPPDQVPDQENDACVCAPGSPGTLETDCDTCPNDGPPLNPDTQACECPEGSEWNPETQRCEKRLDCFGAQGAGCTPLQRDSTLSSFFNLPSCGYGWVGPAPVIGNVSTCVADPHFAEQTVGLRPLQYQAVTPGSLRHDQCCKEHPGGFYCNGDNSEWTQCVGEFNEAIFDAINDGYSWRIQWDFSTKVDANDEPDIFLGGNLTDYGRELRAPYGVRMDPNDAQLCQSGTVVQNTLGQSICGAVPTPAPVVDDPVAGDSPLVNAGGRCERFTDITYGGSYYGSFEVAAAFFAGTHNYVVAPDKTPENVGYFELLKLIEAALLNRDNDGLDYAELRTRPEANDVWVWRDGPAGGGEIQAVALLRKGPRARYTDVDELHGLFAARPDAALELFDCLVARLDRDDSSGLDPDGLEGRLAVIPAIEGPDAGGARAWWEARRAYWTSRWGTAVNRTSNVHVGQVSPAVAQRVGQRTEYVFGEYCSHYPGNFSHLETLGTGAAVLAFQSPDDIGEVIISRILRFDTMAQRLAGLQAARAAGYPTVPDYDLDDSGTCARDARYFANSNNSGFLGVLSGLSNASKCRALASINAMEAVLDNQGPAIFDVQVAMSLDPNALALGQIAPYGLLRLTDVEELYPYDPNSGPYAAAASDMRQQFASWRGALGPVDCN